MASDRKIRLNKKEFDDKVKTIKLKSMDLTVEAKGVSKPSQSRGIVLDDYIKKTKEITDLIWRYRSLLLVDIGDIETTAKKFQEADIEAQSTWKATN